MMPISVLGLVCLLHAATAAASPEYRAVAFLAREVPRWSAENHCFSCHNNGDAARALYVARRLSFRVPAQSLDDTTRWLAAPARWDDKKNEPRGGDRALSHIQFAAALAEALSAGVLEDRKALNRAAKLLAADQQQDGSWKVDAGGSAGAPATYGACLATVQASRVLRGADAKQFREALAHAREWLLHVWPASVPDAAAVLLGLEDEPGEAAAAQRSRCGELLARAQGEDGGWGPYRTSGSEAFDTALAVLALCGAKDAEARAAVRRGRAYLLSNQKQDGSWPETTRPAGGESYAERLSTAGWATLALLATHAR